MITITDIDNYRSSPTVLTIGNFDGVHRGHQELLGMVRERARDLGVRATVVTFDPHTRAVVRPDAPLDLLTQLPQKLAQLAALDLDQAAVVHFTPELANWDARTFLTWLHRAFPLVELWAGEGFALGHHRTGNLDMLAHIGDALGYRLQIFPPVQGAAGAISSTAIRHALAAGDVAAATAMLGRPYQLPGLVVPGAQRGRTLGYPTANLTPPPHQAIPSDGIYATRVHRAAGGARLSSITSIGVRPTFGPSERLIEVYILDFHDDLYGETLEVDFIAHLRPQATYTGAAALIVQMQQDEAHTRAILANHDPA
ncbi:MAG: bifunctional riboflavin kinase/FAD synthetase [Chloroflexota bacterium]|nr:bifunctional riboflavin kinase/FAD synthetase [Chloroflexota bacterium]